MSFLLLSLFPQARIFREIFLPVELTPLEFMQLMGVAERRVMLQGNDLTQDGRPHEEMFLIVEGTADVGALLLLLLSVCVPFRHFLFPRGRFWFAWVLQL